MDEQVESWVDQRKPEHYEWAMIEGNEMMFVAEIDGQIIGFDSFARDEVRGGLTNVLALAGCKQLIMV